MAGRFVNQAYFLESLHWPTRNYGCSADLDFEAVTRGSLAPGFKNWPIRMILILVVYRSEPQESRRDSIGKSWRSSSFCMAPTLACKL
jgi:hypothetical protein